MSGQISFELADVSKIGAPFASQGIESSTMTFRHLPTQ